MDSVLTASEFCQLQYLLTKVSAKLNVIQPLPPSEQNMWWRKPLSNESDINYNMYNSFRSIQTRHGRRDKHWAQYAGRYDQRINYMFDLGKVQSDSRCGQTDDIQSAKGKECDKSKSESVREFGDNDEPEDECSEPETDCGEYDGEFCKFEDECSELEDCDQLDNEGGESSDECGAVCISKDCPCRTKGKKGNVSLEEQESDNDLDWLTESDSESEAWKVGQPQINENYYKLAVLQSIINPPRRSKPLPKKKKPK
jgi:hypothetical protein